ncbi:uncharacterized protein [Onthophagus taurus]|uniref:uncharacterized protein n=1 Tax=Onthophagus taurus TaxID=166361 RepID=UPI0039BE4FA8
MSNLTVSVAVAVVVTLREFTLSAYLAEGCSMQEMAWNYRIGKTTVHCILKETTAVLWKVLQPLVMPPPTVDALKKVADDFLLKWQVPNCIGSIDRKHIHIQAPKKSGSEFYNYKNSFSIILMASVDADYNFIAVDIGASGRNHDSTVFRNSAFGTVENAFGILCQRWRILRKPILASTEMLE